MQRGSATRSGGSVKCLGHRSGLTRPTTSGRRQDNGPLGNAPKSIAAAASSPVRSPGWSAPPEIRPCAPGALPSGRVESSRRGAGGGTVVCICRHAHDSQPGDQGGCGHSTALSASPSTTCSARRAVTALWQWQCRSLIPLFWPDGCCHELGGDGTGKVSHIPVGPPVCAGQDDCRLSTQPGLYTGLTGDQGTGHSAQRCADGCAPSTGAPDWRHLPHKWAFIPELARSV